ncbi:YDG domain-containing protein [Paucibacter sp. O1-1]|nr:YDG domain-containing protein [Paucibacter sp. O1-1]MDA3831198.1 YDG domain-containing protein [Paucibacter sp. O1-1]
MSITCGINCLTITTGNLSIRFNPASYATTDAEILAYDATLTGAGVLDAKAWVFGRGDNKLYDNTTTANVSGLKPDVGGVALSVVLGTVNNASFDTEHVGTQKPITFETTFSDPRHALFAPDGFAPGTYQTRANILVRPLTVNAVTDSRVYNGTTSSVGAPTVIDLQSGDALNGTLTQNFASKNVMGPGGSTLVANGPYTVADGNGGNNYTVTVNTAPGTITPLALVGSITAANKVYDANDSATITGRALSMPVTGDDVSYIGGAARFSDQNVANGKAVTGTGLSLAGADAGNYAVNSTALTTANITPAPLTITANDATKRYGETVTLAATAFTNTPLVGGETVGSVTEVSAGTIAGAVVAGSPYPIIPSDARGGTFLPSNYTINYVNGVLTVTPAPLALSANDASKVFGTVFTPGSTAFTPAGLVNGDTVTDVSLTSTGSPENASVAGSTYPIAITPGSAIGTFTPTNYAITYEAGALTVTPVVVPPVEPPVIVVPPVEPPNVVFPPVEPPIVVVPPGEPAVPPDVVTPPDAAMPPELPYEGPVVPPRVRVPTWVPVVTPPALPPQLTSVPVPVPTPVPTPMRVPVPEAEVPPLVAMPQVPVAQPPVYVPRCAPASQSAIEQGAHGAGRAGDTDPGPGHRCPCGQRVGAIRRGAARLLGRDTRCQLDPSHQRQPGPSLLGRGQSPCPGACVPCRRSLAWRHPGAAGARRRR